jgi:DMSO reductase anchor subunit
LSREIIGFGLFSVLTLTWLYFSDDPAPFGFLSGLAGILMLYAMDRVYMALPGSYAQKWQSSSVLLTAILFAGLVTGTYAIFYLVLTVKVLLFLRSYRAGNRFNKKIFEPLPVLRILTGFIVLPFSTLLAAIPEPLPVLFLLAGEFIDRILFYQNLEVITPYRQMTRDLKEALRGRI